MPSSSSIPAIASLSASVKSTPLVCAPSRSVVSNRYRRCLPMGSEYSEHVERKQHRRREHRELEHDVIEPMAWERSVGFGHDAPDLASSCFRSVVFASHSPPMDMEFRCWAT